VLGNQKELLGERRAPENTKAQFIGRLRYFVPMAHLNENTGILEIPVISPANRQAGRN
jgi:hypothetical protein